MVSLPDGEKIEDMFIRFDVIHERDGRTDRQTLRDSKDRAYASHRAVNTIKWARDRFYIYIVIRLESILSSLSAIVTVKCE